MAKKLKQNATTEAAIDTAALEAVVATIEATEVQETEATVLEAPAVDFRDLLIGIAHEDAEAMLLATNAAINDREYFEAEKNPENANIHRTLKKVRASLARSYAARVMVAAQQDAGFINRHLMDGSRYNVYAIGKYADLVDALAGSGMQNAINIAITRSLFAFAKAGVEFNGEMAKAAASDKIRVSEAVKKLLVRHTVSASTAPTQASSTMQALETLGIVRIEGSRKNPVYKLRDTLTARRLAEVVEAMAA